jgi:cobalt transporter subunit CbtB
MTTQVSLLTSSFSRRIAAGCVALFFGITLLYGVGLAQDPRLHNAAHDTRHAIGFPCH